MYILAFCVFVKYVLSGKVDLKSKSINFVNRTFPVYNYARTYARTQTHTYIHTYMYVQTKDTLDSFYPYRKEVMNQLPALS